MSSVTDSTRRERIKQALQAADAHEHEKRRLRVHGRDLIFPVISLPVDLVLLNPRSHRIRAQVQDLGQEGQRLLSDPMSEESQEKIASLLRNTPGYEVVKGAMQQEGQKEYGIITEDGVLINANTRAVALRDLRKPFIDVIVLPPDTDQREMLDLELQLQMQSDIKQDYTFSNQLLFIEELLEAGKTPEEIGLELEPSYNRNSKQDRKRARDHVEREMRLLALIRRVIEGSRGKIEITYFDSGKRQALIEVDQDYQAEARKDPENALRVRDAQLAAMIAGLDYRKLRQLDATLIDEYLLPAMVAQPVLKEHAAVLLSSNDSSGTAEEDVPGLDIFEAPEPARANVSLGKVYELLTTSSEDDEVVLPGTDNVPPTAISHRVLAATITRALDVAMSARRLDEDKSSELDAPRLYLEDARSAIDKALKAHYRILGVKERNPSRVSLENSQAPASYDVESLRGAIAAVRRALDGLESEITHGS
jgi:hypothetical protein